ncbi:MFS transporter [Shimwellia pseudoproteus]|uniref:MFS transporter n=1 Tax=Shimwellia pseudoproteus TaxID=570012 RepID=UPI0018EA4E0C|nr:MFS transporter [Shimwellia pseudoproteus]MBJ3814454.1 MFS transporter [Shimwellia pseudoproteus]
MRFVLLIGVLSFFADFTHEGARGVLGPYLASLQATAFIVGAVTGFGELMGYALRYFSGRFAEISGKFWPVTLCGYLLQMTAVPALALTHSWQSAAVFIVLERTGRAIRNPPRDAMLSHAAKHIGGYGWTFGIHEACDQFGALCGPLMISLILVHGGSFHQAFAALLIPAMLNIIFVFIARRLYPAPEKLEAGNTETATTTTFSHIYWVYLSGASLVALGFADYPLLAYHFTREHIITVDWVPVLYAIAMGVSGGSSLLLGRLFDKYGFRVLISLTFITAFFSPLVFYGGVVGCVVGAMLWGMGMGVHESIIPAAVSPMTPPSRRASAFGLFTGVYGIFWFIGSAVIGFLYDDSLHLAMLFCLATQLASLPAFIWVYIKSKMAK